MKIQKVSLDSIDIKDERFRISHYFSLDSLVLSMRKIGLINPPVVTLRDKSLVLVSGWKRISACFELSLSQIPVNMLEEEDDLQAFLISFYENLATREFCLLEKAEILKKLMLYIENEKDIAKHYLPLLNIPATLDFLDVYLQISRFEPEIKRAIQEKNIPFSVLKRLAEFGSQERRLILPLLLPLGKNKQKEFLEDLIHMTRREEISAVKLFACAEVRDILNSSKMSPLQKSDKIRTLLRRWRCPLYSSWKESFESSLKKIRWPREISVEPSPYFEDEELSASFKFKNRAELKDRIEKLQELAREKGFFRKSKGKKTG